MCGIAGVLNFSKSDLLTRDNYGRFSEPLKFRGPDDKGFWEYHDDGADVLFFHQRLSIIDLTSAGHQPMTSSSEQSTIVYNGEIYNYRSLRDTLTLEGFQFRTTSDTEVILNGYEAWGMLGLLQRLDGMFAFALYNHMTRELFIARDPFGKKPLYYSIVKDAIVFSSDIRSFNAIKGLDFTIDFHSLGYYFAELATPQDRSIWSQVKKLAPGCYSTFSLSGLTTKEYWKLDYNTDHKISRAHILEKTEELLFDAVKKRTVGDVSISSLLSGGIDSSLIVALLAKIMGKGLKTYSVGFDDQSYNELPFARVVSEKFKTDHTEIKVSSEEAMLVADGVIAEYGEPFADVSMLPTYLICREVSKLEKVVLGGDGGDEMFAGYTHYHQANKLDQVKHLSFLEGLASLLATVTPSYRTLLFRDLIRKAKGPKHKLLSRSMSFSSVEMSAINSNPLFVNAEDNEHEAVWKAYGIVSKFYSLNLMSASLHTRLVNDYLVKVDRASMYASLEMRSPFLDKNLAKFAATIHPKHLFYQHGTKSILKEIAGKFFDSKFIHREKMGFGVPIENWIRQGLRKNIEEVVLGGKQNLIPINYSFVQDIIKRHNSGENHTNKIWSMYVFHRWAQQYKR